MGLKFRAIFRNEAWALLLGEDCLWVLYIYIHTRTYIYSSTFGEGLKIISADVISTYMQ